MKRGTLVSAALATVIVTAVALLALAGRSVQAEEARSPALAELPTAVGHIDNWRQFRGPTGMGLTDDKNLPLQWGGPENKNVLWKAPLKGNGHASPIIWGDKVFVCTADWAEGVKHEDVIPNQHVACYQFSDGKLLWDALVPAGPWKRNDFRSGPSGGYAAATPCTDGQRVYAAFASAIIAAVDFDGKVVWSTKIEPYTFDVTLASSPVLYGDTVILFCAMAKPEDSRVVAYDKATGKVKWQQKLPGMGFGHSTPLMIDVKGQKQMLLAASAMKDAESALRAVDPADGRLLWTCKGSGDVASPAFADGLVYFNSGRGQIGTVVDPTGSGDVSATHIRATIPAPEGLGGPTIVGKYIYQLNSQGVLGCWELATGKKVYGEKLDGISTKWASPVVDPAGRLFFASAGKSFVVQAGPQFSILATNDLGDGNHPSPAVAGGRMILVGLKDVYCIGTPK
jgi:outer membrane protein assembly factor BamB